jgi:AraC family transcriptional regulator of arabinose operon
MASSRSQPFPDAAVAFANYYQFSKGQRIVFSQVVSRMLIWCKTGKGQVIVNGKSCPLQPDEFLFTPWKSALNYIADTTNPFLIGSIHIIPSHERKHSLIYNVAHSDKNPLFHASWRKNVPIEGLEGLRQGSLADASSLKHLSEYIVQCFYSKKMEEWQSRELSRLLLAELKRFYLKLSSQAPYPIELQQMLQYVRNHLTEKLSLEDLARFSNRSPSCVGRLFQKYLKTTPVTYIARAKMERACEFLATTRSPVAQIGRSLGLEDPYYFQSSSEKSWAAPLLNIVASPLCYKRNIKTPVSGLTWSESRSKPNFSSSIGTIKSCPNR